MGNVGNIASPERKLLLATCSGLWIGFFFWRHFARSNRALFASGDRWRVYLLSSQLAHSCRANCLGFASAGFAAIVHFPRDIIGLTPVPACWLYLDWERSCCSDCDGFGRESLERRKTYAMLAPAASLVFFVLFAQRALNLANLLYPKTFDLSLYVFDGSFGFQPSFLMGRAMATSALLRIPALLAYTSLPFVMALIYALRMPKGTEKPTWDIVTLFMLAGIGGWALYNLLPASGPAYVFGPNFPWNSLPYSMLRRLALDRIPVAADVPRNAIPSLHMAWVVLLFWNTKGLSRALRIFMAVYLALTVISTLGTGEHYFVDLIASLPFALFVQAVVWPGDKPKFSVRTTVAASGLGLTLAWLLLVRFGAKWMLITPILPWALLAATGVTIWMIRARSSALPIGSTSAGDATAPASLAFRAHG